MFTHYLTIALRHLLKSKLNFFFKLAGLTLALTSLLVIILYVSYHLSFDTYHDDYKNIYRVNARWMENGSLASYGIVPPAVGPVLKANFPEVVSFSHISHSGSYLIKYGDKSLRLHGFIEADSTIFSLFKFDFLEGEEQALTHPGSIVLTQSMARDIFADEDPLGKMISISDRGHRLVQVTGIIADPPRNTHLHVRALMYLAPLSSDNEIGIDGSGPLYLKLGDNTDPKQFATKAIPLLRSLLTSGDDHLEKEYEIYLQRVDKIHLDPWIFADFTRKGNAWYVYTFSVLGIFVLIIASINYANLSIADYSQRSKEMGIRKVLGAKLRQISLQVTAETVSTCGLAAILGLGLLYLIFPEVREGLDSDLEFHMLFEGHNLVIVGIILLILVALSALYPAWHLIRNKPTRDMKSIGAVGSNKAGSILLSIQFVVSVICICATFIVREQIRFLQTKDPGFDRNNGVVIYMPDEYPPERIPIIKNELAIVQGVEAVSYSTFRIAAGGYYRDWYRVEVDGEMKRMLLNEVFFDHDFFRTTGIEIVAGRNFDPNNPADSHSGFIVNETAVKAFGWDDPIGKRIEYGFEAPPEGEERWEGTIIGVVKDFNVYSMHRKIEPLVMRLPWSEWPGGCVHVRIIGPFHETLDRVKAKYSEIMPDFPIYYSLLSDLYEGQYQNEHKAFLSLTYATWIIVLISAFGIFSLSLFISLRRMKEFGIRKVMGATVRQIAYLHISYFLKIAIISNALAIPLAIWMTETWLSQFAYRAETGIFTYVVVALLSFALVLISAGHASMRSGWLNPVDVIKSE